mgnify:FL=1|jgi:exopolyphosphatase/guanosine-5'-triphosphate,3'-diphosphate pyrophosphatase
MNDTSKLIAAIDVGTNSFHMIIASVSEKGIIKIHQRSKEPVRLGSSAKDMKHIEAEAMKRGIATLKRFATLANEANAQIRAVGTSAVREALNREQFVEAVEEKTGISIEVVSGLEEARLIYLGAIHALPIHNKQSLIFDIGGGSTEFIIGKNGERLFTHSAKIGHIRMTQRFFPDGKITPKALKDCRDYIRGDLISTFDTIKTTSFDVAVACSGTVQAIAAAIAFKKTNKVPEQFNGITLSKKDLTGAINDILTAINSKQRSLIPGMDINRSDVIVGGALILEQIIEALNIDKLTFSAYALREGILFDTLQKQKAIQEFHHLSNLRYESVLHVCNEYRVIMKHALHVKQLSSDLFDALQPIHQLGDNEKELLEAAALLHDVGYHISPEQHHKHTYYLIKNCVLPGFTNDETEIIANIARYHRKSLPKRKHDNFIHLSPQEQKTVRILSGILRITEALDRRLIAAVASVKAITDKKNITIQLQLQQQDYIPDIEIWGAERRKDLLEQTLDITLNFQ